jgi:hypothetical protein
MRKEENAESAASRGRAPGEFDGVVTFPSGEHDDLLDAAATGAAYLLNRHERHAW